MTILTSHRGVTLTPKLEISTIIEESKCKDNISDAQIRVALYSLNKR